MEQQNTPRSNSAAWRQRLITTHLVLASFFLPIAVMFAITGALYTVSIKGSYETTTRDVVLTEPLVGELPALLAVAERELAAAGLSHPTGSASVRKSGDSFELEWTGANRDVSLKPGADSLQAQLVVRNTTWYRRLVQLHKAKGSDVARAISVSWAVALLGMLASGMALGLAVPTYRRKALVALAAGAAMSIAYIVIG